MLFTRLTKALLILTTIGMLSAQVRIPGPGGNGNAIVLPTLISHGVSVTGSSITSAATISGISGSPTLILIGVNQGFSATCMLTDSSHNAYSVAITAPGGGGAGPKSTIYFVRSPVTTASMIFTIAGTACNAIANVAILGGTATVGGPDSTAQCQRNSGGTNSIHGCSVSVTPTANNEVCFSTIGLNGVDGGSFAVSGLTLLDSSVFVSTNTGSYSAYQIQTTAAGVFPLWTWTTSTGIGVTVACFS